MQTASLFLALAAIPCVGLSVSAGAQVLAAAQPQPGTAAGSQRWIVTFATRPFDLEGLRAAIAGHAPAAAITDIVDDLDARARASHAEFAAYVRTALQGRVAQHWWIVDACMVEVQPAQVAALRARPRVTGVYPDTLRAPAEFDWIRDATNNNNHASDAANQAGYKGAGVTVAIPDSGCDADMGGSGRPHATFFVNGNINDRTGGGIGGSRLLVNRQMGSQPPEDAIAHGTAVAACAAGQVWPATTGDAGQAPDARIASYSMSDTANGFTTLTTMVNTWQRIASDAASLGIKVANLSYQGSTPVSWPEQRAMDAAAQVADIAIAVMGGNDTHYAHGALNTLSVGSVTTNTRVVSSFSGRGPMEDDQARFLPDLVANGDALHMPQADIETIDRVASGTSYASPQVAGAMAIYRSIRSAASALETRAAVLATTEAIGDQNRVPADHNRNAYGLGYLRTDRLARFATDPNTTAVTLQVTPTQNVQRVQYRVAAGQWYVAAIAYNRQNDNSTVWSNLDLRVLAGSTVLGTSTTPRNVHERVVFKAPSTGTVDIEVQAVALEPGQAVVNFGLVIGASGPAYAEGNATRFGSTCGPQIQPGTIASVGTTYRVDVSSAAAATTGVLMYGASDRQWGTIPLPLVLSSFGAPGCTLWVSPDILAPFALVAGRAAINTPVPNSSVLVGAVLFHQAAHPTTSNPLGVVFSGGLRAQVAGFRP